MITRDNYEIFFIDYFDGKLNKIQLEELFSFLKNNSDLEEEFNNFSTVCIEPDSELVFDDKRGLKKETISQENYTSWLVAYIEGDLSTEAKSELAGFMEKHQQAKAELEIIKQTKLFPDHRIIFKNKNRLRKGGNIFYLTPVVKRSLSTAASLIILALIYFVLRPLNSPETIVADKKEKSKKEIHENENQNHTSEKTGKPAFAAIPEKHSKRESRRIEIKEKSPDENLAINKSKPEEVKADSIQVKQPTIANETLAEKTDSGSLAKKLLLNSQLLAKESLKRKSYQQTTLSDVFSDQDMKELEAIRTNKSVEENSNASTILSLAGDQVAKYSKSKNISFEKKEDAGQNSITYALGVGNNFSISHTSLK